MAFHKAVKGTVLVGGGAFATVLGLSQFAHYRRKQVNLAYVEAAECFEPVNRGPPSREAQLLTLQNPSEFDILVIGGGATGSGCALDAVTRGLKTALVERDDFSSGTSSRSAKLIHGGVRYLQKAIMKLGIEQYRMVKEALQERANLLEIAPHLSAPLPIMLPVYKWWQLPYYWVGIKLYDLVAGSNCLKSSYVLSKLRALEHFSMFKGQTANYMEVASLLKKTDPETGREHVSGARCKDVLTGQEFDVRAKCVINAMGPFTDAVHKMDGKSAAAICQPSARVRIVMPGYYSLESMGLLDSATSDGSQVCRHSVHLPNHVVDISESGLITIAGGKWTTYRSMAEDTVTAAIKVHNLKAGPSRTVGLFLQGGKDWSPTLYIRLVQDYGFESEVAQHLAATYGDKAFEVAKMASVTGKGWPIVGVRLASAFPHIEAEVKYGIKEYACTAVDMVSCLTHVAFLNVQAAEEALPRIAKLMARELNWDEKKRDRTQPEGFFIMKWAKNLDRNS
ncbi:Glycerol-3-phosphate dehydrogenase, mitochondrial [Heterocephalus glaber]|uniref:Glycerol-3-phosphate dehydrogenase n=1 Tax=Heterocephalus glaber TaxID=10181 RepID=G5BE74_HETGA|nr:Glycerol-3-phosphate dehydrogenase, mitochondrial [Heterocephalus glaber]